MCVYREVLKFNILSSSVIEVYMQYKLFCGDLTYHCSVDIKGFCKPIITKWYVRSMLTMQSFDNN